MAIDMIENNELGALAPSRLGLKQFADENFKNYTGDDDFYNLFGSRKRRKARYSNAAQERLADLPKDCANIQNSIDIINADIENLLKQKSNLGIRTQLSEANSILADFKKAQISQNCVQKFEEIKKEQEKAALLGTLTSLSDSSVSKAQAELKGLQLTEDGKIDTAAQNKKLLIYAGVGIGAIVLIALILKK
jgi:hypothetical protein